MMTHDRVLRTGLALLLAALATLLVPSAGRTAESATPLEASVATAGRSARIAFVRDFQRRGESFIYSIRPDGTGLKKLTYEGSEWSPSWSPDGTKIAFESKRDGDLEIYVMDRDGTNVVQLTDNSFGDVSPAWSPDGQWIAFARSDDEFPEFDVFDIYKMRSDGSEISRLTTAEGQEWTPTWSPDSSRIAFYGDDHVIVMNADGSDPRTIDINHPAHSPDWAPAGDSIFYTGEHEPGGSEIHRIDADGTGKERLTRRSGTDQDATVAPNARLLAFARDWELAVMRVDGRRVRTIFHGRGDVYAPDWGPARS
jgi:TolB protein